MAVIIPKTGKIIPLNIVMTYPVRWNRYRIYRDFVQNFYDSVGAEHWNEKFQYRYDKNKQTLTMEIEGVVFSYEWLLHIGASTKTANSGKYAGYFGEGFKIASLCAVRDYNLIVEMYSGEWKLNVTVLEQQIDNQTVEMLAYKIHSHKNIGCLTTLKMPHHATLKMPYCIDTNETNRNTKLHAISLKYGSDGTIPRRIGASGRTG